MPNTTTIMFNCPHLGIVIALGSHCNYFFQNKLFKNIIIKVSVICCEILLVIVIILKDGVYTQNKKIPPLVIL